MAKDMWWFLGILLGLAGACLSVFGSMRHKKNNCNASFMYMLSLGGAVAAAVVLFMLFALALLV